LETTLMPVSSSYISAISLKAPVNDAAVKTTSSSGSSADTADEEKTRTAIEANNTSLLIINHHPPECPLTIYVSIYAYFFRLSEHICELIRRFPSADRDPICSDSGGRRPLLQNWQVSSPKRGLKIYSPQTYP